MRIDYVGGMSILVEEVPSDASCLTISLPGDDFNPLSKLIPVQITPFRIPLPSAVDMALSVSLNAYRPSNALSSHSLQLIATTTVDINPCHATRSEEFAVFGVDVKSFRKGLNVKAAVTSVVGKTIDGFALIEGDSSPLLIGVWTNRKLTAVISASSPRAALRRYGSVNHGFRYQIPDLALAGGDLLHLMALVHETPIIGDPIRLNLNETIHCLRDDILRQMARIATMMESF